MPLKRAAGYVAIELGCIVLGVTFGTLNDKHWIFGVVSGVFGFGVILFPAVLAFVLHRKPCPECGAALTFRRDFLPDAFRFRCLYDCPRCHITWDTGLIDDTSTGS
jgi:hypothetical protein